MRLFRREFLLVVSGMGWNGQDGTGQDRIGVLTNHGRMIRRRYTVPNTGT